MFCVFDRVGVSGCVCDYECMNVDIFPRVYIPLLECLEV